MNIEIIRAFARYRAIFNENEFSMKEKIVQSLFITIFYLNQLFRTLLDDIK
jgi:hypothetical protein